MYLHKLQKQTRSFRDRINEDCARRRHRNTTGKQVKQMKAKTLPQKTIGNEDKEQKKHSHEWGTCEPRKIQGYECSILEFENPDWFQETLSATFAMLSLLGQPASETTPVILLAFEILVLRQNSYQSKGCDGFVCLQKLKTIWNQHIIIKFLKVFNWIEWTDDRSWRNRTNKK